MMEMDKKTAYGLVKYVKSKIGTPYVYGAKQPFEFNKKYSLPDIRSLKNLYGSYVWDSDLKKAGKVVCDCSGLISAYTQKQRGSWNLFETASKKWQIRVGRKLLINELKKVPIGAILWQAGHVGVFIGWKGRTPYYIAEDGSAWGCRKAKVVDSSFTHALLIPDITYNIKSTYLATNKKKIKAYKSSVAKKAKRTYRKGNKFRIVAEKNGRGLLMTYSSKRNMWVDLKDIKKI